MDDRSHALRPRRPDRSDRRHRGTRPPGPQRPSTAEPARRSATLFPLLLVLFHKLYALTALQPRGLEALLQSLWPDDPGLPPDGSTDPLWHDDGLEPTDIHGHAIALLDADDLPDGDYARW